MSDERRATQIEERLRANGYTWYKNGNDGYQPMFDNDNWSLVSGDGRIVSVMQALDEIERGADVVLAEIAAEQATIKVAQQIAIETETTAEAKFDTAVTAATTGLMRTSDCFDIANLTPSARHGNRTLLVGEIDGQRVAVVELAMHDGEFILERARHGAHAVNH